MTTIIDPLSDPTCVREGTRVWVVTGTPATSAPRVDCGQRAGLPPFTGGLRGGVNPSPFTESTPHAPIPVPIETIQPGGLVVAHDGLPHLVQRVIRKASRGDLIQLIAGDITPLWITPEHRVLAKPRPRTLGGDRDWSASPYEHLERRRELRRDPSPPERLLWSVLRGSQNGFKFRRQHPVGRYIVDFYCREAHLVVEVDGSTHYTPDGVKRDRIRDADLRALGLNILRVPATELGDNLEGVAIAIQTQCRIRAESVAGAKWVQAGALVPGDLVFRIAAPDVASVAGRTPPLGRPVDGGRVDGALTTWQPLPLLTVELNAVEREWKEECVFDLEVEGVHSFVTEMCVVHNCGGGPIAGWKNRDVWTPPP